jgi:hypothetical protein
MIKFEFVVDEADVENIMDAMNDRIVKMMLEQTKALMYNDSKLFNWYEAHIAYLKDLKNRMTTVRVEDK